MIRVPHHVIQDTLSPDLWAVLDQQVEETIPRQVQQAGLDSLGRWIDALVGDAGRFAARGDVRGAWRRLSACTECIGAVFTPADSVGLSGPRPSKPTPAHTLNWIKGFCMASAFRNVGVLRLLDAYAIEDLAKVRADYDAYADSLAQGMRALYRNDTRWRDWLAQAESHSRPENLRVASPSIIARYRTLIPMLAAVGDLDQSAFDAACVDAVKAHKAFYGRGSQKTSPSGTYAILAAGVAAFGVERGLTFNVESGYTPRWLVYGGEP